MDKIIIPVPRVKISKKLLKVKDRWDKFYESQAGLGPESLGENKIPKPKE